MNGTMESYTRYSIPFPLLFIGRATIAKGSGNVPLSKFMRIACGYAEKSGNDTGMNGTF